MEIISYSQDKFDECIKIFMSNLDKYFAEYELEEFKYYLRKAALDNPYFVINIGDEVIGCGGYEKEPDEVFLTWGMIKREFHGQGYGKALTTYRLKAIRSRYPGTTIILNTSQYSQGFYKKQGFKIKAIEKNGFGKKLDKYTMTA